MKNILLLLTIAVLTSSTLKAQTVKENIEKISRNPKTTEQAAKADVRIHDKTITESAHSQLNKAPGSTSSNNSKAVRKRKQTCKAKK